MALIVHTDSADGEIKGKIRRLASKRAATKLRNLGVDPGDVLDESGAFDAAANILSSGRCPDWLLVRPNGDGAL